jgi:tRNA(Ile2) C34 agmatinyltransferase TiaS
MNLRMPVPERPIVLPYTLTWEAKMATITAIPPEVLACPACPKCGVRMMSLVGIFPEKPGYDRRIYECPRCQYEVTEVIEFKKAS